MSFQSTLFPLILDLQPEIEHSLAFEQCAKQQQFNLICGVDEAGRGPLAGPVVAGACIFLKPVSIPEIDDSKKLSEKMRDRLFDEIISHADILTGVGIAHAEEIDEINILQATIQAMLRAVEDLDQQPDALLVDGLQLPHPSIPAQKIIKGDQRSASIGAASIIAKVTRDRMMEEYDKKWPDYGFAGHKGYGTKKHRDVINTLGRAPFTEKPSSPSSHC